MILLTAVTMSTQLFAFIIIFTVCLSFVAGCIWMSSGKRNKDAELTSFRGVEMLRDEYERELFS